MRAFWHFAKDILRYRGRIALATGAALVDAACAFAGFGALIAIIRLLFGDGEGLRSVISAKLEDADLPIFADEAAAAVQLIPADPFRGFAFALGFIFLLSIFGSAMRYYHQATSIMIGLRVVTRIRQRAFHRLLHAKGEYLLKIGSADNLSRVVNDSSRLGRGFAALMGKAVRDLFTGCAYLLGAFWSDWRLTCIFLIGMPLIGIAIRKFGKHIRRASKYMLQQYGKMIAAVTEAMQSLNVVRVHNAEGYERRRFNTINRRVYQQEMKARTARALSSPVIELIALAGVMVVSLVAAWYAFNRPGGDPASMVLVLLWLGMAGASFRPLANLNNDLQEAAAAAERLERVLEAPVEPNMRREPPRPALKRHQRDLTFDNISFAYPNADRPAIRDIDLVIEFGESIAIVGTNGSGKSTLLNLLPRLAEPTGGRVLVDGTDIANVSLRSLRKQIAMVTQQTVLFEGTIADNIAYGRRHTPRADIEAAARAASAHGFTTALPQGYDTMLGEGGAGLSGGQKQRLCIARAILRDPAILILDEATSQIDAESEAQISQAIEHLREGRTTLIIAHRLSTVVDCDRIIVMDDGRVADQGKHQELLKRCGVYQTLVRTQLAGLQEK